MKTLYTLLILIIAQTTCAQNNFESGYFIDNTGKRTDCLIKNVGWKSTPTEIKWKTTENKEIKTATIKQIQEFRIKDVHHYTRHTLSFDLSPTSLGNLKKGRAVKKKEQTVFLKTLLESSVASLYIYQASDIKKFFYASDTQKNPELLVHKTYLIENNDGYNKISENNDYQFQLSHSLGCPDLKTNDVDYLKSDLIKYFKKYIACKNGTVAYQPKSNKLKTKFGVLIGYDLTSFKHGTNNAIFDFEDSQGLRFGAYIESFMPFYNNKLSVFLEGAYTSFSSNIASKTIKKAFITSTNREDGSTLEYKSIDLTMGSRFYFYLNPKSSQKKFKTFIESGVTIALEYQTRLKVFITNNRDIIPSVTIPFGVGLNYDRYRLSFRSYLKRDIFKRYITRNSELNISTVTLAVDIF